MQAAERGGGDERGDDVDEPREVGAGTRVGPPPLRGPSRALRHLVLLLSSLLLSSLELSDAKVYEPSVRDFFGTAAHFCKVVVLKLRTLRASHEGLVTFLCVTLYPTVG